MVGEGWERESRGAEHGGPGAEEEAEDGDGLEGDVGGEEVVDAHADEYAEGEGDADPGEQMEGFAGVAVFEEKQAFEVDGAGERTGDGCGNAELDEKGNPDELRFACVHALTLLV